MNKLIFMISSTINMNVIKNNQPMTMVMWIIIQTMMVIYFTGSFEESFWMSYIMLLIFLGGMMVLFIYITSIASNEMMSTKWSTKMIMIIMTMSMMMIMMDWNIMFTEMNNSETMNMFKKETNYLKKMFNWPNNMMMFLVMMYLFFTLMVISKIVKTNEGPMRSSK
uniref:NADH dehydrogenase subunit 6 n=1 Tax=Erianthus versicolor TaxID=470935 RepID=UPI0024111F65|nr:NADH dehydrogenase subunit 6 [Erianthus versicolor]WEL32787.1 NADH dehydrogenase subunit 6 [Erianthus versicolor]